MGGWQILNFWLEKQLLLEIPACAPPNTTLVTVAVATVACDTERHSTSWQGSVALASVMPALALC